MCRSESRRYNNSSSDSSSEFLIRMASGSNKKEEEEREEEEKKPKTCFPYMGRGEDGFVCSLPFSLPEMLVKNLAS